MVEVALRYGASRQSVSTWKARYEREGLPALEERSRRPHHSPHQLAGVNAVEFDTVLAVSGVRNVLPRAQRIKMGVVHAGQLAHVWADEHSVHILIGGQLIRTLPSGLSTEDIRELRLRGAVPAGPPPADLAAHPNRPDPAGSRTAP